MKNITWDEKQGKVKISFKMNKKKEIPNIDVLRHLQINICCCEDHEDDINTTPIHEEMVPFNEKTCKRMYFVVCIT